MSLLSDAIEEPEKSPRFWTRQYEEAAFALRAKAYTWDEIFDWCAGKDKALKEEQRATFKSCLSRRWARTNRGEETKEAGED